MIRYQAALMDEIQIVLVSLLLSVAVLGTVARADPRPVSDRARDRRAGPGPRPRSRTRSTLEPDLVLVIFLPPLLYSSAFFANLNDLRRDIRVDLGVGGRARAGHDVHGRGGRPRTGRRTCRGRSPSCSARSSPPPTRWRRPRSCAASGSRARWSSIVEGESLLNDGTALVAYNSAVKAVAVGFVFWDAAARLRGHAAGGIAIGLVAGKVLVEIRRRINDIPTEVTISLLSGYAAYLPAEELGVSGVLAAVTTGIMLGWKAPEISTASMRLQGYAVWETLMFLLNALLFVLIGLQLPTILDGLDDQQTLTLVGWGAAVSATVILTRLVFNEVFTRSSARSTGGRSSRSAGLRGGCA